jgi:endonuclease/exonuclease/phosphatase family metal-dependent hydrolase
VNRWGLIELNPSNRKITWSNNQVNPVLAKLDRIFVSTEWERAFPLARVIALPKGISDHNPLLLTMELMYPFGKKKYRFEK